MIGVIALVFLLARTGRSWWLMKVPLAAAVSAGVVLVGAWLVNKGLHVSSDTVPIALMVVLGVGVFGVALAIVRFPGSKWWSRLVGVAAALLLLVTVGSQVNLYYGEYPTVGALVGTTKPRLTAFTEVQQARPKTYSRSDGHPLEESWKPPANLPAYGTVSKVAIPGTVSGFHARDAVLYLPPAYFAEVRPLLPVLVLLPGQPGGPDDWFTFGQVATAMDAFAAHHHGLAPVVVSADANGSTFATTMCTDSSHGNTQAYLTQDVPNWIKANLQVDRDPSAWGMGGYSYGGTCSFQLTVRTPGVYRSFIDFSGEDEPIPKAAFPGVAGFLAVGDRDEAFRPDQPVVQAACERAGIRVESYELPGAHSWGVWRPALVLSLPWYAQRSGLI